MSQELLARIENAEKELKLAKEELEKMKVPRVEFYFDQPVIVSDGAEKYKRYFKEVNNTGEFVCFANGKSSRDETLTGLAKKWSFCSPDPDAKNILNWIPNTGMVPSGKLILLKVKDRQIGGNTRIEVCHDPRSTSWNWSLSCSYVIISYCIIE